MWFECHSLLVSRSWNVFLDSNLQTPNIHLLRNHFITGNRSNVNHVTKDWKAVIA